MEMTESLQDTIIAVSTPLGTGGLGIIRLSGARALSVIRRIFKPRKKIDLRARPRQLVFGDIIDREKGELIDVAYLVYFARPRSYTREDVVEISCHGSPVILEEIVRLGIKAGARLAHAGEFTLRAYLHGRIDILQAEAVQDLITAGSLKQAKLSLGQLRGGLSRRIQVIRTRIVQLVALVEARIEFPDEELSISDRRIGRALEATVSEVRRLVASYKAGRTLAEGLTLAIVGRTNVGKSTLFNALLDDNRAIVSPHPGTTRDYLRERIKIRDSLFYLVDMAGLERPAHAVEKEGIRRSRKLAQEADGVLLVLDGSRPETPGDLNLIKKFGDRKMILVFNKSDLDRRIDEARCLTLGSPDKPWLEVSALKGTNLDRLKSLIHEVFVPSSAQDEDVILHLRQKLLLEQMGSILEEASRLLEKGYSEEICAEEIRRALTLVGRLTGEIRVDEVIDQIFGRFCVGK
jgi:tRNA modification GTPase